MPKVPQYDAPQEQLQPLPGSRQDSVASPALLAGSQEGLANVSRGLMSAGGDVMQIAEKIQERDDSIQVFSAKTAANDALVEYQNNLTANRRGVLAKGTAADTKAWWDERARKDLEALKTDRQRQLYLRSMAPHRTSSIDASARFEDQQTRAAQLDAVKATVASNISAAVVDPRDENIAGRVRDIKNSLLFLGAHTGTDPKVTDQSILAATTQLHKQVLQDLVSKDKSAAAKYFAQYEKEIDPQVRAELGDAARKATAEARGQAFAEEVFTKMGPKAGVDAMVAAARKQFGDDTYGLKAAEANIKDRVTLFEHGQKTRLNDIAAKINMAALQGAPLSQLRNMPEYNQLATDPDGANILRRIDEHQANLEYQKLARANAAESLAFTRENRAQAQLTRQGLDTYIAMGNPDALVRATRAEVANLRPVIGDQNTLNLLQKHDQLTKSADALSTARIDQVTFNGLLSQTDLDPDRKDLSDDDKRRIARLKDAIDQDLSAAQHKKSRPLSVEERRIVAQSAFDSQAKVPTFWGISSVGRPVGSLLDADITKIYGAPQAFIQQARSELVRAGRPASSKEIVDMWRLNSSTWKASK